MAIRNTSKNDPLMNLFEATLGGGIEAQESRGQRELTSQSSQLPTDGLQEVAAKLGIEILGPVEGDRIFCEASLPEGMKIVATDHSMWSNLVDKDGNIVAGIFYKAAFYDRSAHIRLRNVG